MRVTTVIGEQHEAAACGMAPLWKGTYDRAAEVLASADVDVVVLVRPNLTEGCLTISQRRLGFAAVLCSSIRACPESTSNEYTRPRSATNRFLR